MGLIRAAAGAIGSTLHDQWKEALRCDDMGSDILMKKVTTPNGVISNGSTVIVAPGQCAIVYDNGRIVDATAEDGYFVFDSSSTPSLFAGQFGGMFKEMWQRFTYGGATAKEQAVYFFNLKEILDNKFGTPAPVPYKDWGHPIMNARTNSYIAMSVKVKCFGKYTFKINNPFLFMSQIAGTASIYRKQDLTEQMRSEVIASFSNVLNGLGSDKYKIEVLDLPNKTDEIKKIMDENVFDEPIRNRGIKLVSFAVESLTLDDESSKKIDNYEIGGDQYQAQGTLTGAYAKAIQDAANNANGAANGFMGIGMMNMASGGAFNGQFQQTPQPMTPNPEMAQSQSTVQQPQAVVTPQPVASEPAQQPVQSNNPEVVSQPTQEPQMWHCPNCDKDVSGKFCSDCGAKRPERRVCSNCGNVLQPANKFCPECGTPVEK